MFNHESLCSFQTRLLNHSSMVRRCTSRPMASRPQSSKTEMKHMLHARWTHKHTYIYILYYHTVHLLDTWHSTNLLLGWIGGSCPQSRMSIWWTLPPVSGKSPHSCVNENDHSCVDPHVSIHMCRILPKMETQLEHCINGLHTMQYWCRPNVPSSRRTKTIEQPHARLSGYSVSGPPVNENV